MALTLPQSPETAATAAEQRMAQVAVSVVEGRQITCPWLSAILWLPQPSAKTSILSIINPHAVGNILQKILIWYNFTIAWCLPGVLRAHMTVSKWDIEGHRKQQALPNGQSSSYKNVFFLKYISTCSSLWPPSWYLGDDNLDNVK